jgi:hypothetical protein
MDYQPNTLVPLVTVAAELGVDVATLVKQFGDAVVADDAGLRCIEAERSRVYLAAANAAQQADEARMREQAAECAARIDAVNGPIFAKVAAIQQQQEAQQVEPGTPALAVMLGADRDNRLARASRNKDEMLAGNATYHAVTQED